MSRRLRLLARDVALGLAAVLLFTVIAAVMIRLYGFP